jgi:predicted RNA-binding Zn ribbon-like protein
MDSDWRNGFLFVGNQLSLDFLNTRPNVDGAPKEFLEDCPALARWMAAAELISDRDAKKLERVWIQPAFAVALGQLQDFRERFRQVVFQREAAKEAPRAFVAELNQLLAAHPYLDEVARGDSGLIRKKCFTPETPLDVFAPLADSVASLLTAADVSRIRRCNCSNCVLHFYDVSKKGTRRWCSMNMCGNRSKVAAYAERKRAAG